MGKQSGLSAAIAKIDREIEMLQTMRGYLMASAQEASTKRIKTRVAKKKADTPVDPSLRSQQ